MLRLCRIRSFHVDPELDLELVRDQIEEQVRLKRRSGELPEELERELDAEFSRASPHPVEPKAADTHESSAPASKRPLVPLVGRVARKARRLLETALRSPR